MEIRVVDPRSELCKIRVVHSSGQCQTKAAQETPGLMLACNRLTAMTLVLRQHFSCDSYIHSLAYRQEKAQEIARTCEAKHTTTSSCIFQEAWDRGTSTRKHTVPFDLRYGLKIVSAHPKQPPGFPGGLAHEDGGGIQTKQTGSSVSTTSIELHPNSDPNTLLSYPSPAHFTPKQLLNLPTSSYRHHQSG